MNKQPWQMLVGLSTLFFLAGCLNDSSPDNPPPPPAAEAPPNILFIVIDDVGVDQFSAFGYGGAVPANTMSINAIAEAGV